MNNYEESLDNEIYIERKDAHKLLVSELAEGYEYHPCDKKGSPYIIINEYQYCVCNMGSYLEICISEHMNAKYWDHKYISGILWMESFLKALESNDICKKVHKDFEPYGTMSLLYFTEVDKDKFKTFDEVVDYTDSIIDELKKEAINIAKRELIKFFNS